MIIIDILLIFLILAAIYLCIFLIQTFKRITKSIEQIERDLHVISEKTIPLLDNLNDSAEKINFIVSEAEKQVIDIKYTIEEYKSRISNFTSSFISTPNGESPVLNLVRTLRSVFKGIGVFINRLRD